MTVRPLLSPSGIGPIPGRIIVDEDGERTPVTTQPPTTTPEPCRPSSRIVTRVETVTGTLLKSESKGLTVHPCC